MTDKGNSIGPQGDAGEGIYLFCFARRNAAPAFGITDLHENSPASQWPYKNIIAVLKRVPLGEWVGSSAEANLQDLKWVGPRACAHQKVIEQVICHSPVLPVRFGTIFSSFEKLESLLSAYYDTISEFLGYVTDKEEWALKGLLDRAKAEEHLLASESRASALPSSAGTRYLLEKRLRMEAKKNLRSWVLNVSNAIAEELRPQTVESRTLKILSRETSGREMDIVFNWALLVGCGTREDFRLRVEQLNADYFPQGLTLEISGPWPPYSFCPSFSEEKVGEGIE